MKEVAHVIDDGIQLADSRRSREVVVSVKFELLTRERLLSEFFNRSAFEVAAMRGRQREREVLADIAESLSDEPADRIEPGFTTENIELIHHTLSQLSATHREVLTLRFLEDMSLEEVSQVIGCPIGTVKSRLHHAQRLLRDKIEELNHA
ncbi:MAG: sigma-70 family RNA polymerase sigma factor [Planctomycetia bacterium]|nr:sigma-70 family RNA polymerase sigma factor [Planctomycetia bacterium]